MERKRTMTDEAIIGCGRELATELLENAVQGTTEQMNNQIDIMRAAAIIILGIDLGNAIAQLEWDKEQIIEHLNFVLGGINAESKHLVEQIKKGETQFFKAQTEQ